MSVWGVRVSARLAVGAALLVAAGALAAAFVTAPAREITLVVRDMAFYIEGDPAAGPNPTIEVKAGEQVRIVLRNEERGYTHDFAVPALGMAVGAITWNQTAHAVLKAPSAPGTYRYLCQPHALMMYGTLRVTP